MESAASRRESRACQTVALSLLYCLPLRLAFRIRLQIPSHMGPPPSFYSFPRTRTDRPADPKIKGNSVLWLLNAIFKPSKNHHIFCFRFFSKKSRKSWILAAQSHPQTLPKCIQNRCPKKHPIFRGLLPLFLNVCYLRSLGNINFP